MQQLRALIKKSKKSITITPMGSKAVTKNSETSPDSRQERFVVAGRAPEASGNISDKLALGAGCYWGTEKYVVKGECNKPVERIKQRPHAGCFYNDASNDHLLLFLLCCIFTPTFCRFPKEAFCSNAFVR